MAASDLIAKIGARRLREMTGCSTSAPYNWRRDGVPSKHYRTIKEYCDKVGVECDLDAFTFAEAVE